MLKFYGTDLCPHCRAAKTLLAERGIPAQCIDITASTANLKAFLALRDSDPVFAAAKAEGRIGIPAFVAEDGSVTIGCEWLQALPCQNC